MFDTLERLILLQIGAAAVTRERVQEAVNRLITQGRMEREQGREMVNEVLSRAQERSGGARSFVDASVQQGLRGAGIPNREAYEDLLFRVEQLEHRLRLLEGEPTTPRPEAPEPTVSLSDEASSPEPPDGDVAPQPPRDEPGLPPDSVSPKG